MTNLSLFSRRTGGRLGEEGWGDEGLGGADTATSHHHGPDRRLPPASRLLTRLLQSAATAPLPGVHPSSRSECRYESIQKSDACAASWSTARGARSIGWFPP